MREAGRRAQAMHRQALRIAWRNLPRSSMMRALVEPRSARERVEELLRDSQAGLRLRAGAGERSEACESLKAGAAKQAGAASSQPDQANGHACASAAGQARSRWEEPRRSRGPAGKAKAEVAKKAAGAQRTHHRS